MQYFSQMFKVCTIHFYNFINKIFVDFSPYISKQKLSCFEWFFKKHSLHNNDNFHIFLFWTVYAQWIARKLRFRKSTIHNNVPINLHTYITRILVENSEEDDDLKGRPFQNPKVKRIYYYADGRPMSIHKVWTDAC